MRRQLSNPGLLGMTFFLIALFLVLTHATGTGRVIGALGTNYGGAVRALQGR